MNTTLDLLLKADKKGFKKPQRKVEIKRLSKILGKPVIFTCEAISPERYNEIQEQAIDISDDGKINKIDSSAIQIFTVLEGIVDPDLKSKELGEQFGAVTPKDLISGSKLLLPGEVATLYNVINDLSGFGKDAVQELKNE